MIHGFLCETAFSLVTTPQTPIQHEFPHIPTSHLHGYKLPQQDAPQTQFEKDVNKKGKGTFKTIYRQISMQNWLWKRYCTPKI